MTSILLVDDARLFLELERSFLTRTGCRVLLAVSGEEALRKSREHRPDVVVLDARMPGLSGLECCRSLKSDPATAGIPVVFVSDLDDYSACLDAGGDAFVSRPVTRDLLLEALRRFVPLPEREFDRAAIDVRVDFRSGEKRGTGHSKDLCIGGMFLRTRETIDTGNEMEVDFNLPGGTDEPVHAAGTVVRQVARDPDSYLIPGIGLSFHTLGARDRLMISRYVSRSLEEGK